MPSTSRPGQPPIRVPDDADLLGPYSGYQLFYAFTPQAKFSARAVVYVYVCPDDSDRVTFTQVSSVHRRNMGDFGADEVERRLLVDAVSRAKIRISDKHFDEGEVYAIELDAGSMRQT